MMINNIGVIGAGVMGRGITVDLIAHGFKVALIDISETILTKAKKDIVDTLRFLPLLNKNAPLISPKTALASIKTSTHLTHVKNCDFIIENISEKWELKEALYLRLDRICASEICFAADTSCIPITRIGAATNRPDRVIGIHFMNPSYLKSTVEIIRGEQTSDNTESKAQAILTRLEKETILVKDTPGFVSNRISHLFMNEAICVVQEEVANPGQVDQIFKKCFGHTMGPLETADLIGLDTVLNSLEVLYNAYDNPKYQPCPLLKKMVTQGRLGRKSKEGFYKY